MKSISKHIKNTQLTKRTILIKMKRKSKLKIKKITNYLNNVKIEKKIMNTMTTTFQIKNKQQQGLQKGNQGI